ncbi:endonuclease V [Candidatus Pacearchaeota archaeon]|nr:endonuclease V [Candidatus Pacearchaeota archaeon]
MDKDFESRKQEIGKRYHINFYKLEKEQEKLAKGIVVKDSFDISLAERFGAFDTIFINNKILCCFIVCDSQYEIIDRAYVFEKAKFPYVSGFRNYRELPSMIAAFEKINEKPDVVFISGQGIIHPRLGLASHFGLVTGIPTIGVSSGVIECDVENDKDNSDILKKGKRVGKVLLVKIGSSPLYVSPGHNISVKTAYELSKKLVVIPHKRPEPLHLASKYTSKVRKEIIDHV